MNQKSEPVRVTDIKLGVDEIIRRSVECGGDQLHCGRHHVQFFNVQAGYYTREQIEQNLQYLGQLHDSASDVMNLVMSSPDQHQRRKARKGLRAILAHIRVEGMLETIEGTVQEDLAPA